MNVLSLLGFGCKYKKKNKTNKEMSKKIANDTMVQWYNIDFAFFSVEVRIW